MALDGISVFDGDLADAVDVCLKRRRAYLGAKVATANLDFFALAEADPQLRSDLRNSSLVVADGAPVAWLARLRGARRVRRVAGVDLAVELCAKGTEELGSPFRVGLYGGEPWVLERAGTFLEETTGAVITAAISPPFRALSADEKREHLEQICATEPDAVFVALGCPGQERIIADHYDLLPDAIWVGIGGSLDFYAGKRRRAPSLAQNTGFEWLVRFLQEPARLGPRYFGRDLTALRRIAASAISGRLGRESAGRPVPLG